VLLVRNFPRRGCKYKELALDARIFALEQDTDSPPFTSITWEIYDSFRENSRGSIFTILANPSEWREAMKVGLQELQR
jgi:hypothetical protein